MIAICKADFDQREQAKIDAEKELERLKKEGKPVTSVVIPKIAFHEIYGVWFYGKLTRFIQAVALGQFGIEMDKRMHVFIDAEPGGLIDGVYELDVYGHACRLYKWMAQGYHRGLVVLAGDEPGNANALVFMERKTWSWMLNDEQKASLTTESDN